MQRSVLSGVGESGRDLPGLDGRCLAGRLGRLPRPKPSFEGGRWEFDDVFRGRPSAASSSAIRAANRSIMLACSISSRSLSASLRLMRDGRAIHTLTHIQSPTASPVANPVSNYSSVSAETLKNPPQNIPPAKGGGFTPPGIGVLDPFGNKGAGSITRFTLDQDQTALKQPCILFEVTTGRRKKFFGTGLWYRYVEHAINLSTNPTTQTLILVSQSCPAAYPTLLQRFYFNSIKKILRYLTR